MAVNRATVDTALATATTATVAVVEGWGEKKASSASAALDKAHVSAKTSID
ncbi:MAG: hypothetical protein M3171_10135 [Actinomycetota bacterium]|nr:hypothetical protein [Actinomycetota bacterium]